MGNGKNFAQRRAVLLHRAGRETQLTLCSLLCSLLGAKRRRDRMQLRFGFKTMNSIGSKEVTRQHGCGLGAWVDGNQQRGLTQ